MDEEVTGILKLLDISKMIKTRYILFTLLFINSLYPSLGYSNPNEKYLSKIEALFDELAIDYKLFIQNEIKEINEIKFNIDLDATEKYGKKVAGEHKKYFLRGSNGKLYMLKQMPHRLRLLHEVITYRISLVFGLKCFPIYEVKLNINGEDLYGALIQFNEEAQVLKYGHLYKLTKKSADSIIYSNIIENVIMHGEVKDILVFFNKNNEITDYVHVDHDELIGFNDFYRDNEYNFEVDPGFYACWFNQMNRDKSSPNKGIVFSRMISLCPDRIIEELFKSFTVHNYEKTLNIYEAAKYIDITIDELKVFINSNSVNFKIKQSKYVFNKSDLDEFYLEHYKKYILNRKNRIYDTYIATLEKQFDYYWNCNEELLSKNVFEMLRTLLKKHKNYR